jgi:hypothetical protein
MNENLQHYDGYNLKVKNNLLSHFDHTYVIYEMIKQLMPKLTKLIEHI